MLSLICVKFRPFIAGLVVGMVVGLVQGLWVTKLRVPSFVVTLAGFLTWQGALLWVLGDTGTVNLTDDTITGLAGTFFSETVGWLVAAFTVVNGGFLLASIAFSARASLRR